MNRFSPPPAGNNPLPENGPFEGRDSPELNESLPDFLRDTFRQRHQANLESRSTNVAPELIEQEAAFLQQLRLSPSAREAIHLRIATLGRRGSLCPNAQHRECLRADLELLSRFPLSASQIETESLWLVGGYLEGTYVPNIHATNWFVSYQDAGVLPDGVGIPLLHGHLAEVTGRRKE